ncbi:MAG: Grx4 family monothiol glutaredoxin [Rickettsiales bacterium]|jgi:monothiol glutaredoxin|nr:Grx4 family monothiol glutaredoxin [Rickettsiales bacterium]
MTNNPIFEKIDNLVKNNDIVLFMKGSAEIPLCGFSAKVAAILNHLNVKFIDVNILESEELRQGIKEFSDWPTIPQLYIKGNFIGGCDIIKEMFETGELQKTLKT